MEGAQDGAWRGRRCVIVGGGPSLRGFDFSRLSGDRVIAVNEAWRIQPPPAAVIVRDQRLMRALLANPDFEKCPAAKFFHRGSMPADLTTPYDIPSSGASWGTSLETGLVYSPDTGLMALNLACVLGADPIYLLGFDMTVDDPKRTTNWHDSYPESWRNNPCVYAERFVPAWEKYAAAARASRRIVNLNPRSALTCFEFGDVDKVFP